LAIIGIVVAYNGPSHPSSTGGNALLELLVIVTLLSLISVGIARRKNRPWVLRHIEIKEPSDTRLISPAMTAP